MQQAAQIHVAVRCSGVHLQFESDAFLVFLSTEQQRHQGMPQFNKGPRRVLIVTQLASRTPNSPGASGHSSLEVGACASFWLKYVPYHIRSALSIRVSSRMS
jgi:hypothetical protein